jgi:hypothetical protein
MAAPIHDSVPSEPASAAEGRFLAGLLIGCVGVALVGYGLLVHGSDQTTGTVLLVVAGPMIVGGAIKAWLNRRAVT